MGFPAASPVFRPTLGFPTLKPPSLLKIPALSLSLSSTPGETPKFTPISTVSYPPTRPRPAAQLAPGHSGHRLQFFSCHPAPAVRHQLSRTRARSAHAHAPQPTFQESASRGAPCSDWTPCGGVAGIGPRGCRLRGGSGGCAHPRMRKAWLSGRGADACC